MSDETFPANFLWGTATAAHQVEGGNHLNDWWDWEQGRGHIRDGSSADPACDHYRRYEADFDLLRSLHQNAHRFSLEWSRIEPAPGRFSEEALGHYRAVLEALRRRGMEPMVTLHHFTNPIWFARAGGWTADDAPTRFAAFVDRAAAALGDLVGLWITINEPTVIAYQGYLRGEWPPGRRGGPREASRVLKGLILAHWQAFERIKGRLPEAQVGVAHHVRLFDPARRWSPLDHAVATAYQRLFNETIPRSLQAGRLVFPLNLSGRRRGPHPSQDFFGINYYTRDLVRFNRRARASFYGQRVIAADSPRSDLDWEIYPEGLYRALRAARREGLPIYITENGVADRADRHRPAYLMDHLRAVLRAIREGAPVRGYFHWTCFDNFEWAEGYSAKFGLLACDPRSQERTLRPSGRLYAAICASGRLPTVMAEPPPGRPPVRGTTHPPTGR